MGEATKIEWCDHTLNPWWGCQRVSPGCEHCYAEIFSKRVGLKIWGPTSERRFFGDKHWAEPIKWNTVAERDGVRRRVFCASMADVFEERNDLVEERGRLFSLIEQTPSLDWLLLTKRPQNMQRMSPLRWRAAWPRNVWAGCTAEDQQRAEERIPHLAAVPAAVHFLSCEPLLGPLNLFGPVLGDTGPFGAAWIQRGIQHLTDYGTGVEYDVELTQAVDWVIVGSESGPGARPMDIAWARSIVDQCKAARVPVFVKQIANERDRKGGKPEFWPAGDWPREFPEAQR